MKFAAGAVSRARRKTGFRDGRQPLALCTHRLTFPHPFGGERMEFAMAPSSGAFAWFPDKAHKLISIQEYDRYRGEV